MDWKKLVLLVVVVLLAVAIWTSYEVGQVFKNFLTASEKLIGGNELIAGLIFLILGAFRRCSLFSPAWFWCRWPLIISERL